MRIVVFHGALMGLSGGEVNTRDWALGLKARGHRVVAFTVCPGALAEQIRNAGIPVVSDPAAISDPPDLMFGCGVHDVAMLIARFPEVPAIQVAQIWDHWNGYPSPLPQVVLHVAVDELNAELLINEFGVPRGRVRIVHNAVDVTKLAGRREPLPPRPRRALIFTKHELAYVEAVRAACEARGIAVDIVGYPAGRPIADPLAAMAGYDLVVGSARVALEAAVAGAAVLVADFRGVAGMLSLDNLELFRRHNFGREVLRLGDSAAIGPAIDRYDPADATAVSEILRRDATLEQQIERLEAVFAEAIELFRSAPPTADEAQRALSTYLSLHLPRPAAGEASPRHARFATGSSVEARLAAVEARLGESAGRDAELQRADSEAAERIAAAEERLREAAAHATALERDVAAATERIATAEARIGVRIEGIDQRAAALTRQVAVLDAALAGQAGRSDSAAQRLSAIEDRLAQNVAPLAALERRLSALEWTVSTVQPLIRLSRPAATALSRVARWGRLATGRTPRTSR